MSAEANVKDKDEERLLALLLDTEKQLEQLKMPESKTAKCLISLARDHAMDLFDDGKALELINKALRVKPDYFTHHLRNQIAEDAAFKSVVQDLAPLLFEHFNLTYLAYWFGRNKS